MAAASRGLSGLRVVVAGIVLAVVGVVLLVAIVVRLMATPDDLDEQLRSTPGYDITFPGADLLYSGFVGSLAGAGAQQNRWWGVHGTTETFAEDADEVLTDLGWEQVEARDDTSSLIGRYALGDARMTLETTSLPARIPGGRIVGSGSYDFIVISVLSNGEAAQREL